MTPLHHALGESEPDLTWELFQKVIDGNLPERADLDWKSNEPPGELTKDRPDEANDASFQELAKDVAAMANSGGGMIVYGVKEAPGAGGRAGELTLTRDPGPQGQKTIRQVMNNLIFPPVTQVQMQFVPRPDDAELGVFAIYIEPSDYAPHLVHPKGKNNSQWFHAPWRDGPDTTFMGDRMLADSYRLREHRLSSRAADFESAYENFLRDLGADREGSPHWVVAMARPLSPRTAPLQMDTHRAQSLLKLAYKVFDEHETWAALREVNQRGVVTRYGLRRVVVESKREVARAHGGGPCEVRVELHLDGTITIALTRRGAFSEAEPETDAVAADDLLHTCKDLLAIIYALDKARLAQSDYQIRVAVAPRAEKFRSLEDGGGGVFRDFREADRLLNHRSVDVEVSTRSGRHAMLTDGAELINQVMSQVGWPVWTYTPEALSLEIELRH